MGKLLCWFKVIMASTATTPGCFPWEVMDSFVQSAMRIVNCKQKGSLGKRCPTSTMHVTKILVLPNKCCTIWLFFIFPSRKIVLRPSSLIIKLWKLNLQNWYTIYSTVIPDSQLLLRKLSIISTLILGWPRLTFNSFMPHHVPRTVLVSLWGDLLKKKILYNARYMSLLTPWGMYIPFRATKNW